jgi:hypothetical protein
VIQPVVAAGLATVEKVGECLAMPLDGFAVGDRQGGFEAIQ